MFEVETVKMHMVPEPIKAILQTRTLLMIYLSVYQ